MILFFFLFPVSSSSFENITDICYILLEYSAIRITYAMAVTVNLNKINS